VIDAGIITLTTNNAWERYDERMSSADVAGMAARQGELTPEQWRELNLQAIEQLSPGRLHRIQRDFQTMLDQAYTSVKMATNIGRDENQTERDLQNRLRLVNNFFPHRIYATDLSDAQAAAGAEIVDLAQAGDRTAFDQKATTFFADITGGLYPVHNGKLDFYEYTSVFPAGTYDALNTSSRPPACGH